MHIKEIEIKDILGCQEAHLHFDQSNVYVVQSESKCPIRAALTTAVKLIFNPKYIKLDINTIGRGYVRIVFTLKSKRGDDKDGGQFATSTRNNPTTTPVTHALDFTQTPLFPTPIPQYTTTLQDDDDIDYTPCTSQQALEREIERKEKRLIRDIQVTALRSFHENNTLIEYCIDGGAPITCDLSIFHARFNVKVEAILTVLEVTMEAFKGNWLRMISTDFNENWNLNSTANNPFRSFLDLYLQNSYDTEHYLSRLTNSTLISSIAWRKSYKAQLLDMFLYTRHIFEYISRNEYTVWFMLLYNGDLVDISTISVEDLHFDNMKTYIQTVYTNQYYQWNDAEHTVQDLLFIAFQISLAQSCKQNVMYLQKLDELAMRQTIQAASAASINAHSNAPPIPINNYLQYIIDVCLQTGVAVIMEYPGGLWEMPENANLIKCCKIDNSDNWTMKTVRQTNFETPKAELSDLLGNYLRTV